MKLMNLKKMILISLLTVTSLANASGGVSGGGGGTLPSNPVSTGFIEDVIKEAKRDLRLFVKYKLRMYNDQNPQPDEKKLYGGKITMWNVLENTKIELREKTPCYDANKKEVDGSIHSSKKEHICISSFRIAPKLIKQNARIETLALIIHELAHLLGADEKEATEAQRMAVHFFSETTEKTSFEMLSVKEQAAFNLSKDLRNMADWVEHRDISEIVAQLKLLNLSAYDYSKTTSIMSVFSTHDRKENHYLWLQTVRLSTALWVQELKKNPKDTYAKDLVNRIFQGQKQITYKEFRERQYADSNPESWDNEIITRIDTTTELKDLLVSLSEYFAMEHEVMFALFRNLSLPAPNVPKVAKINPWGNFIGEYAVVNHNCKFDGMKEAGEQSINAFKVYSDKATGKLELRIFVNNGYFDLGGLYDGAYDSLGGSQVSIDGNKKEAIRIAQLTSGYLKPFNTRQYTLKQISEKQFQMIKSTVMSGSHSDHTAPEASMSCVFNLDKK